MHWSWFRRLGEGYEMRSCAYILEQLAAVQQRNMAECTQLLFIGIGSRLEARSEPCSNFSGNATVYGHKMPFYKRFSSLIQG